MHTNQESSANSSEGQPVDRLHFLISIFFTLLGPIKVIPTFARVTRGQSLHEKHKTAFLAVLFSTLICSYLILTAQHHTAKFHITPNAIRITAGIMLFLSGLRVIFDNHSPIEIDDDKNHPLQIAVSPLATPVLLTPAAMAVLIHYSIASRNVDGMYQALWIALGLVMCLNLIVMYFNDFIMKIPGFMPLLKMVGAGLIIVQLAAGVELILISLTHLGLIEEQIK